MAAAPRGVPGQLLKDDVGQGMAGKLLVTVREPWPRTGESWDGRAWDWRQGRNARR